MPLRTPEQKSAGLPGGEGMQQIYDLAYSPSNPSIVYLGVDTSQVWKSIDGGKIVCFVNCNNNENLEIN